MDKNLNDFKYAKVGDEVYSIIRGWGVVTISGRPKPYAINVKFKKESESYTDDGFRHGDDLLPELFTQEIQISPFEYEYRYVAKLNDNSIYLSSHYYLAVELKKELFFDDNYIAVEKIEFTKRVRK